MKLRIERLLFLLMATAVCVVWTSSNLIATAELPLQVELKNSPLSMSDRRVLDEEDMDQKPSRDAKEPYFVLHVGPPKTATTTIQCALHHVNENLANEDSYYFVGKTCPNLGHHMGNNETGIPGHHLLMGLNDGNPKTRGYNALKSRMEFHRSRGNNIVYSNEGFANHMVDQNITWELLLDLFVGWKVRVVIGYRHYYEWIRSLYYQQFLHDKKYTKNWPNQGRGKSHPSFLEYLDYHLRRWETSDLSVDGGHSAHAFGHHLTLSTYKKFSLHFDDVQIFNLYEDGDLATNFVCNMLPNADNTCDLLRSTNLQHSESRAQAIGPVKRASKSFDAQRIAEAAYINGYIDVSTSKETVVNKVESKIQAGELSRSSSFLACPSPELEARFLKASIAFEKEMISLAHHRLETGTMEKIKDVHTGQFQKAKADQKFCEVDTKRLLSDHKWRKFVSEFSEPKDASSKKMA
jgi:hypothetical protein